MDTEFCSSDAQHRFTELAVKFFGKLTMSLQIKGPRGSRTIQEVGWPLALSHIGIQLFFPGFVFNPR